MDEDTLQIHKVGPTSFLIITLEEVYSVKYDDKGWMFLEDVDEIPSYIQEMLEDRDETFAEADVSGYPVEFSVSYSGQNALFDSAWREEKIRPESPVAKDIQNEVSEVILDVTVDEQGQITITDLKVWPDSTSVSVDI
jgi:hypothetical protein